MSDQARLAEIDPDYWHSVIAHCLERTKSGTKHEAFRALDGLLAALREAERRAEEAGSKLATATDTIRSLTALASEREAT